MSRGFDALELVDALRSALAELGLTTPTAIQAEAIPALLEGKHLLAEAPTGSGKTVAFVLPMLQGLNVARGAPRALILCPTRELSVQVARVARSLARHQRGMTVAVLTGGEPARPQVDALAAGVHVVIGTPGRVLDHLRRGTLALDAVNFAVLDEADRMLEMGFREDVELILERLPKGSQMALFSATLPEAVEELGRRFQTNRTVVRARVEKGPAACTIAQYVHFVEAERKDDALEELLSTLPFESALVFVNLKVAASAIAESLAASAVSVDALHGDLAQPERVRVLAKFRNGSTRVLVATDVAARGLDVEGLDLVVNFDLPTSDEVYVHRIGRTGRAGKTGLAVSLCAPSERSRLEAIEAFMGARLEPIGLAPAASGAELDTPPRMETLRISGGRKDKLRPADILGALTGEASGLRAGDVGKIEIHDHVSYVAVARSVGATAERSLARGRIKGRRFRVSREP